MNINMKKIWNKEMMIDGLSMLAGCLLSAFAINSILVPNGLSVGGFTGIALILQKLTGINYSYIYYVFSIAILIAAFVFLGKKAALKIIVVSILYPTVMVLMNRIDYVFVEGDMFLVCIYFSLCYGLAGGLIMRRGFGFGGTDTLAKILHVKVFKNVSVSQILLIIDAIAIALLGIVFGRKIVLYALVNHVIYIFVLDYILFGFRAKLYKVSIISKYPKEISEFIFKELGRGVTIHDVVGAYTNEKKKMITCICSPSQSATLRRFLASHYPDVFMEVSPMVAVYAIGKRFIKLDDVEE